MGKAKESKEEAKSRKDAKKRRMRMEGMEGKDSIGKEGGYVSLAYQGYGREVAVQ